MFELSEEVRFTSVYHGRDVLTSSALQAKHSQTATWQSPRAGWFLYNVLVYGTTLLSYKKQFVPKSRTHLSRCQAGHHVGRRPPIDNDRHALRHLPRLDVCWGSAGRCLGNLVAGHEQKALRIWRMLTLETS